MSSLSNNSDFKFNNSFWYLNKFNIFDNFSNAELESVTKILHLHEFNKREPIVLPAEKEKRIYFLINGKAKLSRLDEDGKEVILKPRKIK